MKLANKTIPVLRCCCSISTAGHLGDMSQCVLLTLPEAVIRSVLIGWIPLKNVARLDLAFCSSKLRPAFLNLAFGPHVRYSMPKSARYEQSAQWLISRSVRVDGIRLQSDLVVDHILRDKLLSLQSGNLRWITVSENAHVCGMRVVRDICDIGMSLKKLTILGSSRIRELWDDRLEALTRACHKLEHLGITSVTCTSEGLRAALQHCGNILSLKISVVQCTEPLQVAVPTLQHVRIYGSTVNDTTLAAIAETCKSLQTMHIFGSASREGRRFTDEAVWAVLQGCPLLRETDVEFAKGISQELRVELARRCNFNELDFEHWSNLDDALARAVLTVSPALERLRFASWSWLTDATLAACGRHCPLLTSLELGHHRYITTEGLLQVIKPGNKLRSIILTYSRQFGNEVVLALAQYCPLLEVCALPGIRLTDATIVKLAEGCPRLWNVVLCGADVGDVGVTALATHCPEISRLRLDRCPNITKDGVRTLKARCAKLKTLSVS
jgi:hypothetical protein